MIPWHRIPQEIWDLIFEHLLLPDLRGLSATSRDFRHTSRPHLARELRLQERHYVLQPDDFRPCCLPKPCTSPWLAPLLRIIRSPKLAFYVGYLKCWDLDHETQRPHEHKYDVGRGQVSTEDLETIEIIARECAEAWLPEAIRESFVRDAVGLNEDALQTLALPLLPNLRKILLPGVDIGYKIPYLMALVHELHRRINDSNGQLNTSWPLSSLQHVSCNNPDIRVGTGLSFEDVAHFITLPSVSWLEIPNNHQKRFDWPLGLPKSPVREVVMNGGVVSASVIKQFGEVLEGPCLIRIYWGQWNRHPRPEQEWSRLEIPWKGAPQEAWKTENGTTEDTAEPEGPEGPLRFEIKNDQADVYAWTDKYGTALHAAAAGGQDRIVESLLLAPNVDVNAVHTQSGTALSSAASEGHEKIVDLLLSAKADVQPYHPQSPWTVDALARAAAGGHVQIVAKLLDTDTRLKFFLALNQASWKGHEKIVEQLLAAGADPNEQRDCLDSVLSLAAIGGHMRIVDILLNAGAFINNPTKSQDALHRASEGGHEILVDRLLAAGAWVNKINYNDRMAIHLAANNGHDRVVARLLKAGADINHHGWNGSPLAEALAIWSPPTGPESDSRKQVIKLLLSAGARVNDCDRYGRSPLLFAACSGWEEGVQLLLDAGVDVNAKGTDGVTAVQIALAQKLPNTVDLLVAAGAEVDDGGQRVNPYVIWRRS